MLLRPRQLAVMLIDLPCHGDDQQSEVEEVEEEQREEGEQEKRMIRGKVANAFENLVIMDAMPFGLRLVQAVKQVLQFLGCTIRDD